MRTTLLSLISALILLNSSDLQAMLWEMDDDESQEEGNQTLGQKPKAPKKKTDKKTPTAPTSPINQGKEREGIPIPPNSKHNSFEETEINITGSSLPARPTGAFSSLPNPEEFIVGSYPGSRQKFNRSNPY